MLDGFASPPPRRSSGGSRRAAGSSRRRDRGQEPADGGSGAGSDGGSGALTPEADQAARDLLSQGSLEVLGRLVEASNETWYCAVSSGDYEAACVYKPISGERPLWDFPVGTLAGREVSAYAISRAAGWDVVPPTVMRDGPFGPGMCQLWIEVDPQVDLIELARRSDHPGLRDLATFDAVVNNADRKIGHLLPVRGGHLYGCDHGVCFAEDYKLRTVLWQWRGKSLPRRDVDALRRLHGLLDGGELAEELSQWLSPGELAATTIRVDKLLKHRAHPYPPEDWPAIPWPPY
jgi:uncharacterized repeat protein (TIGR03843 family)